MNIIAYIQGSEYPDEYIYITGHTDHEGVINGTIYPGADDNGSGTAAIMEIAEAFKLAENDGYRPKRSLVFLHVTAEEVGLHGSRFYTENPIFPIEQTATVLNTDMIGRVDPKHRNNEDYIYLIGSDRISTELHFVAQEANETFTNLEIDYTFNDPKDPNNYFYRSDHYNFAAKGIPVIFFFNGEHEDYTKPTDSADKINYPLLKKRSDLIFATTWYLVNADKPVAKEVL
ncbi:MAG: M28 family peptidase, partial [Bacteroidota bacterium]